jgi:hypothetical protein
MAKQAKDLEPMRVETPRWNLSRPQLWHDGWRGTDRVLRFDGNCVVCRTRTYSFDDGENDPRGVLGDHAACPFNAKDNGHRGPDVPACFLCQNEEPRYLAGLEIARRRWARFEKRNPMPTEVGP